MEPLYVYALVTKSGARRGTALAFTKYRVIIDNHNKTIKFVYDCAITNTLFPNKTNKKYIADRLEE